MAAPLAADVVNKMTLVPPPPSHSGSAANPLPALLRRVLHARVARKVGKLQRHGAHAAKVRLACTTQRDELRARVVRLWFTELWARPGALAAAPPTTLRRSALLHCMNAMLAHVGFADSVSPKHALWRKLVLDEVLCLPPHERRTSTPLRLVDRRNMHSCATFSTHVHQLLLDAAAPESGGGQQQQ